ncbi:hypothetical protein C8Q79DRAFT_919808 [Trametes meyenii]|nr:hypothetical protein C8Q79DRAFT_919808 [Trametes meyenii]
MIKASSSASSSNVGMTEHYYHLQARNQVDLGSLELPSELEEYLDILTDVAEALGVDDLSFSTYSNAIDRLDAEEVSVAQSLSQTRGAEDELTLHLLHISRERALMERWTQTLRTASDGEQGAAALDRQKAALTSKAKEYQKELSVVTSDMPDAPPVSITELAAFKRKLKEQEHVLKEKRSQVEAFQGLPPNIDLARHALAEARDKQMELIQLRERLLAKMVDGVS